MTRMEEYAKQVKDRIIETLNGHVEGLNENEADYLAEKIIKDAVMPYIDDMVDLRMRLNYAHGDH
jgi:hypothetical protein